MRRKPIELLSELLLVSGLNVGRRVIRGEAKLFAIERSELDVHELRETRAVLLDLLLPEVSGLEILEHLIETAPEMLAHVAVITAAVAWSNKPQVRRARTFVQKPFELREVELALRVCCNGADA